MYRSALNGTWPIAGAQGIHFNRLIKASSLTWASLLPLTKLILTYSWSWCASLLSAWCRAETDDLACLWRKISLLRIKEVCNRNQGQSGSNLGPTERKEMLATHMQENSKFLFAFFLGMNSPWRACHAFQSILGNRFYLRYNPTGDPPPWGLWRQ